MQETTHRYPVEVTEKELPGGGKFRHTTLLTPQEVLKREVAKVLAEGPEEVVRMTEFGPALDTRQAMALAVARLFGLKLATPHQQESAITELREGRAPTKRRASHIGLIDLLMAIGNWENVQLENTPGWVRARGPVDPDEIRKAAYRSRLQFVRTDVGWCERGHDQADDELRADGELDVDFFMDESTKHYLDQLTPEQRALWKLKFAGYSKMEAQEMLGWPGTKVNAVWRSLAADRSGKTLHNELVFWMCTRYKERAQAQ